MLEKTNIYFMSYNTFKAYQIQFRMNKMNKDIHFRQPILS